MVGKNLLIRFRDLRKTFKNLMRIIIYWINSTVNENGDLIRSISEQIIIATLISNNNNKNNIMNLTNMTNLTRQKTQMKKK